jgi:hypothetical protein
MLATVVVLLSGLAQGAPGAPADDARYWRVADRLVSRLDHKWVADAGAYRLGWGGVDTPGNANLLTVHSIAAVRRHSGPSRQDARARAIVRELLATPPYVTVPSTKGQPHAPGWTVSMTTTPSYQHMAVDAEVIDGLAFAWRARHAIELPDTLRALLRSRVAAVARSRFWRWPSATLNQINWPATVESGYATVTGDNSLLRRDLRLHIRRFVAGVRSDPARAGNLGPGLRFHYLPTASVHNGMNIDSAEYGSMVAAFTRFYASARRRGMAAPSARGRRLLGAWLRRVLAGYWTHGGYLNWDTGYGFARWHQIHKYGLAQQALIGIASTPHLASSRLRARAAWMLDRSFAFHERQARRGPAGVTAGTLFGVPSRMRGDGFGELGAARVAGNAARAIAAGLGRLHRARPPALYAFDPDTGRLAVTTPRYNTAVVPVSQGAFPYGGIELARLYDGDQEVAANIGGRPPASFGLLVRDTQGRRVLVTQTPSTKLRAHPAPLRLTKAPAGVAVAPRTAARRPYAGAFRDLRAVGHRRSGGLDAHVRHRFTASFLESRWSLRRRAGDRRYSVAVLFPSSGSGARITALRRDGARVGVGHARIALNGVAYLHVESSHSGYVVLPRAARPGVTARAIQTASQASAPQAGPTLMVELARRHKVSRLAFAARMTPVPADADPAAAARRLAWR